MDTLQLRHIQDILIHILNKWLPIYNVGVNTFSVFVGVSTIVNTHWFQSATTGGLKKARDTVGINTASINFTCSRDNHATYMPILVLMIL